MNKNYFGFKFPSMGKYNNAEFSAWVSRVNSLAMATGADVLKCGEEILNAIAQKAGILLEMVNSTKASVLTAKIAQKDEEVNQLHRFIFNVVKAQQKAPIKSIAESADAVMIALTPYKEASTKPYQEQNQLLKGMIHDLGKLAEEVVEIQLGSAVETLTLTIAQMDVLLSQRSSEQISSDLGQVKTQRVETEELLWELYSGVIAHARITPSEALEEFLAQSNKLIAEAESAYAHRISATKKEEDEEEETETENETQTE